MSYSKKLKSPKWLKKKISILQRDEFTCRSCGSTEHALHVHHKYYEVGKEPWDYTDEALVTYCEYCHNTHHLIGNLLYGDLLELIKKNQVFIKPIAQICILVEKLDSFEDDLKDFLNEQMSIYLQSRKAK